MISNASAYQTYDLVVPAGETRIAGGAGEFVAVFSANLSEFFVRPDGDGQRSVIAAGVKLSMPIDPATGRRLRFKQVLVENPGATSLVCKLAIGSGDIQDNRFSSSGVLSVTGTVDIGTVTGTVTVAGAVAVTVPLLFDNNQVSIGLAAVTLRGASVARRRLRVWAGLTDLWVGRPVVTTANGIRVPAGESLLIEATESIAGIRATGAAIAYVVEEK